MNRKKTAVCLALFSGLLMAAAQPAWAGRSDVGTSGAVFLKLNAGARPVAMGEAFAGVADDVNAIFFNPAGPARLQKVEFTAQYGSWFQSIGYNALAIAYPVPSIGTFGVGVVNLDVTDIERRASDTIDPDGKFGASDYAYMLHYSRLITQTLSAGVNAKLISQKLDDKNASAMAADAGVLWQTPLRNLSAGLVVQNAGQEIKFINEADPLPLNIKAGLGYVWQIRERAKLIGALDINMPRDNDMGYNAGAEYAQSFSRDFGAAVRAGYKTMSQEKLEGLSGLTAGAGIVWRQFSLDFAWVPYGTLGDTFRYSLLVRF